jgi:protein-S-isoprenylcysteine O-methyltransferase Ste14
MNAGMFLRGLGMILILTALLLLIAGRPSYWQAWVFGGVNCLLVLALSIWLSDQADLIRSRMKPGPSTKGWDRVLMALFFPLALMVPAVASLDAGRFGWSRQLPAAVYIAGYIVFVLCALIHIASIRVNSFYTSTVSIEPDRGHQVIDSGPYRFVRHPGYTGIIFMEAGIALVLGSVWALVPAGMVTLILLTRTVLEDRALRAELPGYGDYAGRVRYRLLPGIW